MSGEVKLRWEQFASAIAEAGEVSVETITPESRLLEDLGLDSLALSEVVVLLMVDFGMSALEKELASREWERVTVGELFDEYQRDERPARGKEYVIRERRSR